MAKSPIKFVQIPSGVVFQVTESGRQALCYSEGRIINMPSGVTVVQKPGFALASMEQVKAAHDASPGDKPAVEFLSEDKDGVMSPYAFPAEPEPAPAPAPQA